MQFDPSSFTHIPYTGFKSQIYRSAMPNKESLECFKENLRIHKIYHVVILCESKESAIKLKDFYDEADVKVIAFPIKDFCIPEKAPLLGLVKKIMDIANQPEQNILIHCKAGIGRTGLILASLVMEQSPEMTHTEAIDWVREVIPGAVESPPQKDFLENYREPVSINKSTGFFETLWNFLSWNKN